MPAYLGWLIASLLLGIAEVLSVDFFFLMLAIAALGAAGAAFFGFGLVTQVAVFSLLGVLLLFLVRPWGKGVLHQSNPNVSTNVDALVGKSAVVTEEVSMTQGRVRLQGEIWSARTENDAVIAVDTRVEVVRIEGATAVVA